MLSSCRTFVGLCIWSAMLPPLIADESKDRDDSSNATSIDLASPTSVVVSVAPSIFHFPSTLTTETAGRGSNRECHNEESQLEPHRTERGSAPESPTWEF